MSTPVLYYLDYSPWSEKASWALDYLGVAHKKKQHMVMLGAPLLRFRTGRWRGPVSVPVLVAGDRVIGDSFEIALYANTEAQGDLFPADQVAAIRDWNRVCEDGLAAGRALVTARVLDDTAAVDEGSPIRVPKLFAPLMRPMVRMGAGYLRRKYRFSGQGIAEQAVQFRASLDRLRAGGDRGQFLLGQFSFADIAMAAMLTMVKPPAAPHSPLGPASRRAWTLPDLASNYADLIDWRDALYQTHRDRVAR